MNPPGGGNSTKSKQLLDHISKALPEQDPIRIQTIQHFDLIKSLGSGRFGEVSKYVDTKTGTPLATKQVNLQLFNHWSQDLEKIKNRFKQFIENVTRLQNLGKNHERIAKIIGVYADSEKLMLLTEFFESGSVKQKVGKQPLTERTAIKYLREALDGVHYLHSQSPPLVHTDIKAANLLISSNGSVKLTNFGLVKDLCIGGYGMAVAGMVVPDASTSLLYLAPEVLLSELGPGHRASFTPSADIWSLGCTFVEMLTSRPPYGEFFEQGVTQKELVTRLRGPFHKRLPYTGGSMLPLSSDTAHLIVDRMFQSDAGTRPTAAEMTVFLTTINELPSTSKSRAATYESVENFPVPPPSVVSEMYADAPVVDYDRERHPTTTSEKFTPMETLMNGATRRKGPRKKKKRKNRSAFERSWICCAVYGSRFTFFLGILSKAIFYVLSFITVGLGSLALFLLIAYALVWLCRQLISHVCDCDLMEPQYLVISGIFLILLFALLFSCCMVALGEYKFRKANNSLKSSRFWMDRPENGVRLFGLQILKPPKKEESDSEIEDPMIEEDVEIGHNLPIIAPNLEFQNFYLSEP